MVTDISGYGRSLLTGTGDGTTQPGSSLEAFELENWGFELVNSSTGTSSGEFSHFFQQCIPCLETEYILNPNRDRCQVLPRAACVLLAFGIQVCLVSDPTKVVPAQRGVD
eukprot:1371502-Rhodomonas_salina.4